MNTIKALTTGASKSIGLETGRQMARKGYQIFIGCRNLEAGETALNQIKTEDLEKCRAAPDPIKSAVCGPLRRP